MDARKKTVQAGYDALGDRYAAWSSRVTGDPRERFLEQFSTLLPDQARVLDLGCGTGSPQLAERFTYVGVDLSERQIDLARRNIPAGTFIRADLANHQFPPQSFDGIAALYSITHVPRDEHQDLFRKIGRWLRPGGVFLATLSVGGERGWSGDWLGVPMYFSGFDADTNRDLLRDAGLVLETDEIVAMNEPGEGVARFLWVIATRPGMLEQPNITNPS